MLRRLFASLALALCATLVLAAPVALPALSDRVVDLSATLSPAEQADLVGRLAALERERGAQVAILLLPTTQPESIEQFGIRLAEHWKIGRRGVDDGVIVIVAKDDRRMRIEVGYGLEGTIPDAIARRIIDEEMAPRFRQGDFAGGLRSTVDRLARLIGGEALPPPAAAKPAAASSFDSDTLLFIAIFVASVARALFGIAGSLAWLSFGTLAAAAIAALITFVASFLRSGGGSWHGGGGGGGGSRGGGFSGGGGSFGGGGASGRW